jgi:hypothetical protein
MADVDGCDLEVAESDVAQFHFSIPFCLERARLDV